MRRIALVAVSALAASLMVGSAIELSVLFDPASLTPDWWFTSDTAFVALLFVVIVGGFGVWQRSQGVETDRGDRGQQISSAAAAIAVFTIFWLFWEMAETLSDLGVFVGVTMVVYAVLHTIWTYFQYRSQVTRSDVAVRRTQGAISRDIRDMSAAVFGFILLGLSMMVGLWSGLATAMPEIGEILLPFSGEIAYIVSVITGYLAIAGTGFFGEMGGAEWAGLMIVVAFIALMIQR